VPLAKYTVALLNLRTGVPSSGGIISRIGRRRKEGPVLLRGRPFLKVLLPFPGFPLEAARGLSSQIPVVEGGPAQGGTDRTGSRGAGELEDIAEPKPESGTSRNLEKNLLKPRSEGLAPQALLS